MAIISRCEEIELMGGSDGGITDDSPLFGTIPIREMMKKRPRTQAPQHNSVGTNEKTYSGLVHCMTFSNCMWSSQCDPSDGDGTCSKSTSDHSLLLDTAEHHWKWWRRWWWRWRHQGNKTKWLIDWLEWASLPVWRCLRPRPVIAAVAATAALDATSTTFFFWQCSQ